MVSNFRDAMSNIPTSVSILATYDGIYHSACTISSLVSVDISNDNPKILFVLKKESHIGSLIAKNRFFTINVLADNQQKFASEFSKLRDLDQEFDSNRWKLSSGNFIELKGCRVIMDCEINQVYGDHLADIYVANVLNYKFDSTLPALIYDERKYGSFLPNSHN